MAATSMASSLCAPAALASSRSSLTGASVEIARPAVAPARVAALVCKAERTEESSAVSRRAALTLLAGVAALTVKAAPAEAAYGEAANIFAAAKKQTGFIPYTGKGFVIDIPAKWNPSREIEFPGTVLRYEDNFDATNNLSVVINDTSKSSITEYGPPEAFLDEVSFLLGKQSYFGSTASEGGFDKNLVSTASLLDQSSVTVDGKDYYKLSLLTRTADGDEGGKHQLITAAVSDGKLYILKVQAGDKRWFKGAKKFAEGAIDSFQIV